MCWIIVAIPPIIYAYYVYVYERRNESNAAAQTTPVTTNNVNNHTTTYTLPTRIKNIFFDCIISAFISYTIGLIINFILKEN